MTRSDGCRLQEWSTTKSGRARQGFQMGMEPLLVQLESKARRPEENEPARCTLEAPSRQAVGMR
jgi:hypothetical protein